jgi:ABA4-like protein
MTPELVFTIVNAAAFLSWAGLAALPGHKTVTRITGLAVPALLATLYIAIVAARIGGSGGGFSSLAAVTTLFADPWLLLAGWIHYLAFDLFVGSWEVGDARTRGMSHALVLPCLALTFLFGPAGWLLYLILRLRYPGVLRAAD